MTQRYAKVLAESVRDDFAMVEEKLKVNKTLTKVNGGGVNHCKAPGDPP
jgi:hypothetical protein